MVAANIFITEERKQRIDFSDPYHSAGVLVYGLKANIASAAQSASGAPGKALLTSIDDLKDKRIGVQLGTVYDIYATQTFPKATGPSVPHLSRGDAGRQRRKSRRRVRRRRHAEEVMHVNTDLVPFGEPIFKSPVAAGFAKKDAATRAAFNTFLKGIRQDGTWADMVDRWMTRRSQQMPVLPRRARMAR